MGATQVAAIREVQEESAQSPVGGHASTGIVRIEHAGFFHIPEKETDVGVDDLRVRTGLPGDGEADVMQGTVAVAEGDDPLPEGIDRDP